MAHSYSALEPRKIPAIYKKWFEDGWLFEVFAAILGMVLIIVLCVILRDYNGKPVPSLGSVLNTDVTLNFVVSLLLGFAVPALMLPVAECINQLKWIWFSSADRPLEDLDTFDQSSRGTLGGGAFLWKLRARSFASLGAFLAVVQLAVAPLAQNALLYPSQIMDFADSSNATVLKSKTWEESGQQIRLGQIPDGYDALSTGMKAAIQNGLLSGNTSVDPIRPSCLSVNCTIGPYQSLAVCASFADISSSLTNSTVKLPSDDDAQIAVRYNLPGGHFLQIDKFKPVQLNFTSATLQVNDTDAAGQLVPLDFSDSIAFKNVSAPIADVFFIYQNWTTTTSSSNEFSAIEFVLEWCVQTFNTSVKNGNPTTHKLEAFHGFDAQPGSFLTARPNAGDSNDQYTIEPNTHYSLQRYLRNLLDGNVTGGSSGNAASTSSDAAQALWVPFGPPSSQTQISPTDGYGTTQAGLSIILENIATTMTNQIRARALEGGQVTGTLSQQRTVVQVQWGYIVAPIVFMIFCLLFFAATLIYQCNAPTRTKTWKSSSLAVLHALAPEMQGALGGMRNSSALKEKAKGTYARLDHVGNTGWRLKAGQATVSR